MNDPLKRILFVPDCHHPYADYRAWGLMLRAAQDFKPHTIVVGGDFVDFDSVSMHPRRVIRDVPTLADEFDAARKRRAELDALEASLKVYIKGNHENRFDRMICSMPALRGLTSIEKEIGLTENGWHVVEYHREFQLGKLWVTHDLDNAGENAHSLALKKAGASIVINHTHRIGYTVRGNIRGKPQVGAMFGWLGDSTKIEYKSNGSARHEWALGFGVGLQDNDGTVFLAPCPIVDYRVCCFGKLYR
jgi:predicted phosphodiesterase